MDDAGVRVTAFKWLEEQVRVHGEVLPRKLLVDGFILEGQRVSLISVQGIFKPKVLSEIPISITTTAKGPYSDRMGPEGVIIYSYRGTNPQHPDNAGLRKAMTQKTPLIYFHSVVPGKYLATWPVFIVGDNPDNLEFRVAVDDRKYVEKETPEMATQDGLVKQREDEGRREYITTLVKQRLHQQGFRERVLDAYHQQCAMCRLRHTELLDAAHIIPDGEPGGEPVLPNGIALCKLHHAAFDGFFLGVRPDLVIEVRKDILDEQDGPMLMHGLKLLHGASLWTPKSRGAQPSTERLEVTYRRFLSTV